MKYYAAPPCLSIWAQQPFLAGTYCLRYEAIAMHLSHGSGALKDEASRLVVYDGRKSGTPGRHIVPSAMGPVSAGIRQPR